MKQILRPFLFLFLTILSQQMFAQSGIKGQVVDQADDRPLQNATVMLLQAKDSILMDFTRADEQGNFTLSKSDTMDYLLIVSYPKFGDYAQTIDRDAGPVNLNQVRLSGLENLIEEVLVQGRVPVVIKGDTVEYDAGSFAVQQNAKVEDLLKVLPGITVDASGKITAQGKTVEKVLVDGEEFFGDDPTLVTRNVRTDMVDKVQVYEKKSEAAERTGVDDGQRVQTINLKLKEDAKNGMFGKLEGAAGNDGFYLGKVAVNKFRGSQKIGAYGIAANDGTVSLGWQDEEKFGVGSDVVSAGEDGETIFVFGAGDEFSNWNGRGRPQAINTGISFMNSWKDGKNKVNFNYKYGRIENNEIASSSSQQNLAEDILNRHGNSDSHVENQRHRFNARYDGNLDSLTLVTVKLSGTRGQRDANSRTEDGTLQNGSQINDNSREQTASSQTSNISYDGMLTRKFTKAGRSITLRLAGNNSDDDGDGFLRSETNFYGANASSMVIDQRKDIQRNENNFQGALTYTEPLSKSWRSSIGYQFNSSKTHSINNSFNRDGAGEYTVYDEEFSNDFNLNNTRNSVNLMVGYKVEKLNISMTNNLRYDALEQLNNNLSTTINRNFLTYNPSATFRWNINSSQILNLNYKYDNRLPSTVQMQPLRQNTDPLNIVQGNESLTPSRNHTLSGFYQSYNLLQGKFMYGGGQLTREYNSIQQSVTIEEGIRTMVYDNIDDNAMTTASLWGGIGRKLLPKYQVEGRFGLNANLSNFYNYMNGALNNNQNYSYGLDITIQRNTTKTVDFDLGFTPGWRRLESSLQPEMNSSGFTMGSNSTVRAFLPAKIQIYATGAYTYEAPTEVFNESFQRFVLTPGVSKRFLKNESLAVDVYVNDVLNQNVGFRRSQIAGMISQESYNTISRYFMVKLSWDFSMMNGVKN